MSPWSGDYSNHELLSNDEWPAFRFGTWCEFFECFLEIKYINSSLSKRKNYILSFFFFFGNKEMKNLVSLTTPLEK